MVKAFSAFSSRLTGVIAIMSLVALSSISMVFAVPTNKPVELIFDMPISLQEFNQDFGKSVYEIREILFQDGDIQGGYTIPSGLSLDEAIQKFSEEHSKFLNTSIQSTQEELNKKTYSDDKVRTQKLLDDLNIAKTNIPSIRGLILKSEKGVGTLSQIVPSQRTAIPELSVNKNESGDVVFGSATRSTNLPWIPFKGTTEVNQSYARNTFFFRDVAAFHQNATYEHETQVYNKNYADYSGYWSSNMPSAYYDTPFWDDIDNFTIGTSQASQLTANTEYFTYMSLRPGTASSATFRIKGQIGHRSPTWCHSTWCIWADATSPSLVTGTAPFGGISWIH